MRILMSIMLFMIVSGCGKLPALNEVNAMKALNRKHSDRFHITAIEQSCINNGLINIADLDSSIFVKIIYSTDSNVMHYDAYGDFGKAYLQKDVALKVVNANKLLKKQNSNYSLIIYDAARPLSVQQRLWDSVKMPEYKKINFIANPATGSLHNYGCAVDLSIVNEKGIPLDMGTNYDSSEDLAYPMYEDRFCSEGKLSKEQIENRKLLRNVMRLAGFSPTVTEWWHFNATSLQNAKSRYNAIL
jgi:zinc D-Ala-D-Ala dipeptidase